MSEPMRAGETAKPALPLTPSWASDMLSIGVTGTNGKTTTTSAIATGLEQAFGPSFSSTTLGTQFAGKPVAVARTHRGFLAAMRHCHVRGSRTAVIECTSKALHRGFAQAWPMDIAVVTNLSHDHMSDHGSWEHYLASKAQLFIHLRAGGAGIVNAADGSARHVAALLSSCTRLLSFASDTRAPVWTAPDVFASDIRPTIDGTSFRLTGPLVRNTTTRRWVAGLGAHHVENILAAALALHAAGLDFEAALALLADRPAPRGRFQLLSRAPMIAVDYAHTPDALQHCLSTARALVGPKGRLSLVFGAGGARDRSKRAAMGRVARAADRIYLTDDNPRDEDPKAIVADLAGGIGPAHSGLCIEHERSIATRKALDELGPGDIVVIAGKGHETTQEVASDTVNHDDARVVGVWLEQQKTSSTTRSIPTEKSRARRWPYPPPTASSTANALPSSGELGARPTFTKLEHQRLRRTKWGAAVSAR